jgi:D-glycero-D-manno-heptose 1,7-bisphosphate phosphatase
VAEVNRAVFLDRDGVLNRQLVRDGHAYAPGSPADLEILPGVPESLARLRAAGFILIVVTNQPDVVRALITRAGVEAIHQAMRRMLPLDDIRVCYHDDADGCACRKPSPGMLYAAAVEHDVTLAGSFMIGDRWRDIEAGHRAGCTTVMVDHPVEESFPVSPDLRAPDLPDAVRQILLR